MPVAQSPEVIDAKTLEKVIYTYLNDEDEPVLVAPEEWHSYTDLMGNTDGMDAAAEALPGCLYLNWETMTYYIMVPVAGWSQLVQLGA